MQIRETRQLSTAKRDSADALDIQARSLRRQYKTGVEDFAARYDASHSPRDSFLDDRNKRLGRLEREQSYLDELRTTMKRIDKLSLERAELNDLISTLTATQNRLTTASLTRVHAAMTVVSTIAKNLLRQDVKRQEEFENPTTFTLDFGDDAMKVDGKMNFAESSNFILKNTSILALFSAATIDDGFWHPRFLLMDNIEDKGMEQMRSHNFQRLIIERSNAARHTHQVIFTTSMLAPDLEDSDFTVGPKYTRDNKTLSLPSKAVSNDEVS